MVRNIGLIERLIRLLIGVVILGLYGALESPWKYLTLIGLVPVGTALTGSCPLYQILGRSTVRRPPAASGSNKR
ncbi:MAG: DUF2892 domain-containing protein [Gemmatimonadales bacterium]